MPRNSEIGSFRDDSSELDLRALLAALKRRRKVIAGATLSALVLVGVFVNVVSPRYVAEAQVLLENEETFFTRPDRSATPSEQASLVDPEAVGSQIQLITSRDLAARAVEALRLRGDPEFDPSARGISALRRVLVLLGLSRDPTRVAAGARIAQAFQDKLTVYSPVKTRVITIQFQSKDAELAARAANQVADLYIAEQSDAKRRGAKEAADALGGQIADLRVKLSKADAEREQYRVESGLLAGNNNLTISGQQLAEINSDLSRARSAQADAQAKASLLRELLRAGKTADVPDVVNNDLVRRVAEQRVTAEAQLAQESRSLLPGHPRIKELAAQVAGLDAALKAAAKQAVSTLENEAKIAAGRVANVEIVLGQQKKVAGAANGDEVRLRSLDRIAQSFKDQLDSSTAKYQEALARETSQATPADARIIARAVVPQDAVYPKKLAFMGFGTIATFVFAVGLVLAAEMLKAPSTSPVLAVAGDRAEPDPADLRPAPAAAPEVALRAFDETPGSVREASPRRSPRTAPSPWNWRALVARLKVFGQSAAASREGEGISRQEIPARGVEQFGAIPAEPASPERRSPAVVAETDIAADHDLASRIVAAHRPGRGLQVVATQLGAGSSPAEDIVALGRQLAGRGRSIIVDLNAAPAKLAALAGPAQDGEAVSRLAGLSELLSGGASFAEVIHRDHASRLHFIPTGWRDADFRDFDLILDALSETYDFIMLLAPAFPTSEIAKVMAPYADFVVLSGAARVDAGTLRVLEGELMEAGARDVLVIGRTTVERRASVA